MPPIHLERIERQRDVIYRRTRSRRIREMDDAVAFINDVGFALLFASTQAIELPSLYEAVKGRRDAHIEDWDADSDRVWVWKNDLTATKRAYYGKALASGKPVFISLKLLPYILATLSTDHIRQAYERGEISYDAKRLHDTLDAMGPTPTMALRNAVGMETKRYQRALDELQRRLVILPVGAVNEHGAWLSQIFELTHRWFPHETERAHHIDLDHARRIILVKYLTTVLACKASMLMRVFGWRHDQTLTAIRALEKSHKLICKDDWIITNAK